MILVVILLGFTEFFIIFVVMECRVSLKLNPQKLLRLGGVKHVRKKKGSGLKCFLSRERHRFFKKWQADELFD